VTDVSVRDLRNHGGDVLDAVMRGESVTITLQGKPVAELRPWPGAREDSDIDLLVEAPEGRSSFGFVGFKQLIEQVLGRGSTSCRTAA
jgi:prevent-host-death family protein